MKVHRAADFPGYLGSQWCSSTDHINFALYKPGLIRNDWPLLTGLLSLQFVEDVHGFLYPVLPGHLEVGVSYGLGIGGHFICIAGSEETCHLFLPSVVFLGGKSGFCQFLRGKLLAGFHFFLE